jgi:ribonuclease BN (tRNA processing enzyme)
VTFRLTVLGCAGSTYDADLKHPCSSYLVETPWAAVLLDCGFGTFASYLENARTSRLDALFISHAHRDHSCDVEAFVTLPSVWRDRPRVLASAATIGALQFDLDSLDTDVVVVDDGSEVDLAAIRIECSATTHQMATLAAQVSLGGCRLVYSSDTGPGWFPPPAFHRPDVALLESTLERRVASSTPFHLDAQEAAALAEALNAQATVITHVPPRESGQVRLDIAKRAAPGRDFLLAATGQRLRVESSFDGDGYK